MIRSLIEDLDSEFCECEDGAEALAAFQLHRPDWVLMDLAMRRMDGLTATRQIIAIYPDAKIAIVTNHDDASMRSAARDAGACAYIPKENLIELRHLIAH